MQRPTLFFLNPVVQEQLGPVYDAALENLLTLNSVRDDKHQHDPVGRFADPPGAFIRAGGGYDTPWTRDASINSWAAGSLLEPEVARNTLWAVCERVTDDAAKGDADAAKGDAETGSSATGDGVTDDAARRDTSANAGGTAGYLTVQRDNQWWDQVIWVTAAWDHYCVTGDRAFLEQAYAVAARTLADRRRDHFNERYGLFTGPAFFADGIAAYPEPEYDPTNGSSFVLDHHYTQDLMALSTNCVYANAYRCAARMAAELHKPADQVNDLTAHADAVKTAINTHLWSKEKNAYAYFIHGTGPKKDEVFFGQEGSGIAFALLFDIASPEQTRAIVKNLHRESKGIVTLWPTLPRFEQHPGRHNVMVWPLVNGLWACAAAGSGHAEAFAAEVQSVADLVRASELNFYEIYDARTGQPDGGWQAGHGWPPVPNQTWSATTYLAAIYRGLFGMDFTPDGITFAPCLPAEWGAVTLKGLHYRDMTIYLSLGGAGTRVKSMSINGKPAPDHKLPADLKGAVYVEITME